MCDLAVRIAIRDHEGKMVDVFLGLSALALRSPTGAERHGWRFHRLRLQTKSGSESVRQRGDFRGTTHLLKRPQKIKRGRRCIGGCRGFPGLAGETGNRWVAVRDSAFHPSSMHGVV
jgi:hypothetical protein